jgi:flavin-dependent dehydrogenase
VIVAGGGPSGSVCAARLASKGRRVVLLERERHPRFHLGESMLPNSLGVLEAIGVLPAMRERFLVKRGARFVDGQDRGRSCRYSFAEAFHARWTHAFQVPRDAFDELLFRHAQACGADAREGWTVTRIVRDAREGGRAVGVEARDPQGRLHALDASFVVDATGRDAMSARAARDARRIPDLDRTALYTQVRGAWRDEGEREGDIQIVVFPQGLGCGPGWFWLIPFADGRTSVGAVVSSAWVQAHRAAGGSEALFDAAVAEAPAAAQMLSGSQRLLPPAATADFSFRVETLRGEGWIAVGDATGFIDPLFSTGLHLGLCSALRGADAVHDALTADDLSPARFDAWERDVRAGADLFLGAVQAFYAGQLAAYLFADDQRPFLRRAITSLLAGDVFDPGARWLAELRSRFARRGNAQTSF